MKYSQERKPSAEFRPKQTVLAKLAPPHQRTVKDVAAEEGISPATLYHWCQQARLTDGLFPGDTTDPEGWTDGTRQVHRGDGNRSTGRVSLPCAQSQGCSVKASWTRRWYLHGDNGSPLKGATVQALLGRLGITASFSRPRVSDDNAWSLSRAQSRGRGSVSHLEVLPGLSTPGLCHVGSGAGLRPKNLLG